MRSIRWGGGDGVSADDHEADFMRCAGGDELAESRFSAVGLEQLPDGYRAAAELAAALCGMHRLRAADATDQATAIAAGVAFRSKGKHRFVMRATVRAKRARTKR